MNFVINLDKPVDTTSQQAVVKVKRLLGAKKAGHAGTLDPMATGILIVCLNEATKITRFLLDLEKEYVVQLKLGQRTDTYDSTGRVVDTKDPGSVHEKDIRDVLGRFTGHVQQIPPMYSAVKIDGAPLYKLARKGISVERRARDVYIHQAELLSYDPPFVSARIICSKGTYIRTLCDDIGNALGIGAHMTALTRTRVGNFRIEDAVSFAKLIDKKGSFFSMDEALTHLREILLDQDSWQKAKNGVPVDSPGNYSDYPREWPSQYVRMKNPEHVLFGIGIYEKNSLRVERLFNVP